MSNSHVSVQRVGPDVHAAVGKAMDGGGLWPHVRRGDTVLVKPNFATMNPRPGVTTNPLVLEGVLAELKSRAARVLVGESDGGYASFRAEAAFASHGLSSICRRTGAESVNLSEDAPVRVERDVLGRRVIVHVSPRVLGKIDVGVSIPVMKTHVIATLSLGLKNLWGCDADGMRLLRRTHLPRKVALLAEVLNMRLAVVDGTTALDGRGPVEGTPVRLGVVAAGDNLVSTDATVARLMGFDPARVPLIRAAHQAGLGPIDATSIRIDYAGPWPLHRFRVRRQFRDRLASLTFRSDRLSRLVYDSAMTPWVYGLLGRRPRRGLRRSYERTSGSRDSRGSVRV